MKHYPARCVSAQPASQPWTHAYFARLPTCSTSSKTPCYCVTQDESSIAAHLGERAPKLADGESVALDQQDASEDVNDEDVPDTGTHLHLPYAPCSMQCYNCCGYCLLTPLMSPKDT